MNETVSVRTNGALVVAEPQLFVFDMQRCLDYYRKLGFDVAFAYGDPVFYSQVKRDGVALNLRLIHEPLIDQELREAEALLSTSIVTEDVNGLYLEFREAGADFYEPLKLQPWGAWTFIVRDSDGNLLLFAGSQP